MAIWKMWLVRKLLAQPVVNDRQPLSQHEVNDMSQVFTHDTQAHPVVVTTDSIDRQPNSLTLFPERLIYLKNPVL
jgi:hypothetical protein